MLNCVFVAKDLACSVNSYLQNLEQRASVVGSELA